MRENADRTQSVAFGPGLNPHILILSGALPYSMPLKHLKDRNQDLSREIEIAEVDKFYLFFYYFIKGNKYFPLESVSPRIQWPYWPYKSRQYQYPVSPLTYRFLG